jgi:integrase
MKDRVAHVEHLDKCYSKQRKAMKYLKKTQLKDGTTVHRFVPPDDVRKAGVVKSQTFTDGRAARYEVPRLLEKVEAYRNGDIKAGNVGPTSKIKHVINYYLLSKQFASLASSSQEKYEGELEKIIKSSLGEMPLNKLTAKACKEVYEGWVEDHTVARANERSRLFSVVINFARSLDLINDNPMSKVKKLKHEPYTPIWTQVQVEAFLEVAFTKFEWRNIGLLVMMCYEWAQRPTDICHLKWTNLNLEAARVKLKQSKRGAEVEMPIEEPLLTLLKEQKGDWGFQELVIPNHRNTHNAYVPLKPEVFGPILRSIKQQCGLPEELKIGHLRKTAITEFVAAGVDSTGIMQVTGHKNISSLNPYMKHTYEGAKTAQSSRKGYKDVL